MMTLRPALWNRVIAVCISSVLASCAGSGGIRARSVPANEPTAAALSRFPIPAPLANAAAPKAPNLKIPPLPSAGMRSRSSLGARPPFFTGEAALSNGVYYLAFASGNPFGYYSYLDQTPSYMYHFDLGTEYFTDANDGQSGLYIYDFASGHWWYTSPTYPFPYIYDFSLQAVLYYYSDTNNAGHYTKDPRYFFNFGTHTIIRLPDPGAHVANYLYACAAQESCVKNWNVGISASWMAQNVDWNIVYYQNDRTQSDTSSNLAAAHAKHLIVYVDPNISTYCTAPSGKSNEDDFPEDNSGCGGPVASNLTPQNGGFAHAFQHQINGNRLHDYPDGLTAQLYWEPFYIGDPDVQSAFNKTTLQNQYATDVFEDDAGGVYDCVTDYGRCDANSTYGPPHYGPPLGQCGPGYWCYKYGETAIEWDRAANPQQAYLTDAMNLANASAHNVIGNNGGATNSFDLQWVGASRVKGVMIEGAWTPAASSNGEWIKTANAVLTYHSLGKYVVEYEESLNPGLLFLIASHWIVYDPTYSVEAIAVVNSAPPSRVSSTDSTFAEETVVPWGPLVANPANNSVLTFQKTSNLFVREYYECYQNLVALGHCAAIVNADPNPQTITGLTTSYGHSLVQNVTATWAAGGTAQWSTSVPTTIQGRTGLIFAQ